MDHNGRVNEVWQSGFGDLRKSQMAKRWLKYSDAVMVEEAGGV